MRRTSRTALMVALLGVTGAGCTSVSGGRTGFANRWRTMASTGGKALPTETGPPGATVAAELGAPEVASRAAGRISGRVVDSGGRPVPNAEVRVADGTSRVGRDLLATSDETGRFTLRGLRSGVSYSLIAEGDVRSETLVGRATARAPSGDVRIRLASDREEDVAPATAEADDDGDSRRVVRASNRLPDDETVGPGDDPFEAPNRKRVDPRVNVADLPPPPGADEVEVPARGTAGERTARAAWRRDKADPAATSTPDSLNRPDPPKSQSTEPAGTEAKAAPSARPPEDDGPNPLPPAKERPAEPLTAPASEPSPPASTPAPTSPALDPPTDAPPPSGPAPEAPPSSPPVDSAAIPAEVAPKRRATWAEVAASPEVVAAALPTPMSTRRVPPREIDSPVDDGRKAAPERKGILGLRGRKPEVPTGESLAAASCRFDAKTQRLIDFQLPGLDGKAMRLQDMDADYVLIDFWGSWCKPCLASIPHLVELQNRYDTKTLRVVGIAKETDATAAEQAQRVDKVARSLGVNYPLLLSEADGRPCPVQEALHIQAYPTMILVDRSGQILWRGTGAEGVTLSRLDRVIAARADASVLRR